MMPDSTLDTLFTYIQLHSGQDKIVDPEQLQGFELVCLRDPSSPVHHAEYFDEYIASHEEREARRLLGAGRGESPPASRKRKR